MSASVQDWRSTTTAVIPSLALSLGAPSGGPASSGSSSSASVSSAGSAGSAGSASGSSTGGKRLMYGEANARSLEFVRKRDNAPASPSARAPPATPPHQPASTATAPASPSLRPSLIRKKSGELVKSSLKVSQLPRTKSLPNAKNVHFPEPSELVDVRRFNRLERPVSVSLSESESSDSEEEEDQWIMTTPNWAPPKFEGARPPVYLENVHLTGDYIKSSVLVKNLGFSKRVVVRYSTNFWKTVNEVEAQYTDDIKRKDRQAGYDRFVWTLPIHALPLCHNSYNATPVFFAIRYTVNHQEIWDNNDGLNYELSFRSDSAWEHAPPTPQPQPQRDSSSPQKPRISRMPSHLDETAQGTPKVQSDVHNAFKSRYSFGSATVTPAPVPVLRKDAAGDDDYESILERYCFYGQARK